MLNTLVFKPEHLGFFLRIRYCLLVVFSKLFTPTCCIDNKHSKSGFKNLNDQHKVYSTKHINVYYLKYKIAEKSDRSSKFSLLSFKYN